MCMSLCKYYATLHKEFEHPQMLVSKRGGGTIHLRIPADDGTPVLSHRI